MMLDQDETALYELVRFIGWDEINAYLLRKGYADTILGSPDLVKTEETAEDKEKVKPFPIPLSMIWSRS